MRMYAAMSSARCQIARGHHEHKVVSARDIGAREHRGAFKHRAVRRNCDEMSIGTLGAICVRAAVGV